MTATMSATESPVKNSLAAYIATGLFVIIFLLFAATNAGSAPAVAATGLAYLPIGFHLAMVLVVAALPAPWWARTAGIGWLTVDMAVDIMLINGVPFTIAWPVRLGSHMAASLFIAGASWKLGGSMKWVGYVTALLLGGYSVVAPSAPAWGLMPAMVGLIVWLVLASRYIASTETGATSMQTGTRLAQG